jgi:Arc/MetJ-type ribon-helix-helix transcriptional regulator
VTHGEFIGLRLPSSLAGSLDAWIAAQPEPRPSRSEAIRRLLAEALGKPADVKSPALPPASDAFLRALGHQSENGEGAGVRLRKAAK